MSAAFRRFVAALDRCQGFGAAAEPGRQDFQSDAARRVELLRLVDFAHAAPAKRANDLEITKSAVEKHGRSQRTRQDQS